MAPRKLFTIEKVAVDPKKSAKAKAAAKGKKGAVAARKGMHRPAACGVWALVRLQPAVRQAARGQMVMNAPPL